MRSAICGPYFPTRKVKQMTLSTSLTCENCSKTYQPERANQLKYCSKKCRRAAMRQRKTQVEVPTPEPTADTQADGPFAGFPLIEAQMGDVRANELFAELGRRDSTKAEIESLVRKELIHRRLELEYQTKRSGGEPDLPALDEIKRLELSILRLKVDLGLNFDQKRQRGSTKTTAGQMISGFLDVLERFSPDQKLTFDREQTEALAAAQTRVDAPDFGSRYKETRERERQEENPGRAASDRRVKKLIEDAERSGKIPSRSGAALPPLDEALPLDAPTEVADPVENPSPNRFQKKLPHRHLVI